MVFLQAHLQLAMQGHPGKEGEAHVATLRRRRRRMNQEGYMSG